MADTDYTKYIKECELKFNVALKVLPSEGNLVYEYNPFYNYRLNEDKFFYKNLFYTKEDLVKLIDPSYKSYEGDDIWESFCEEHFNKNEDGEYDINWYEATKSKKNLILKTEVAPVFYQKGLLTDFVTDLLGFSLNNPVNITPQYSYDNSVNLIINDGKNPPRLINSRFSATKRNLYQVCNRKGNNDSNIYDEGIQFDIDTSLYKKINEIPKLKFLGVDYGGNLSIGNYHFYFKYIDDDGNESDFFAESGLVSIFIGNNANSIYSGFQNENSHKLIKFQLTNTDPSYLKVVIYYTRATSGIYLNSIIEARLITLPYKLNDNGNSLITINGYEQTILVSIDEINTHYLIYGSAETQATALNMLFLGNVDRPKIPYEDLADCALRILPVLDIDELYDHTKVKLNYTGSIYNTYYDPMYIYNKVGYWDDEIYRLGVVFILADNTLTEVFNIRGAKLKVYDNVNDAVSDYTKIDFRNRAAPYNRVYINYDEENYSIITDNSNKIKDNKIELENIKGVIHINCPNFNTVIGLNFIIPEEVLNYLQKELNIKGFFFVRLKRIPTTLCLAYTIGVDKLSHTPVLPIDDKVYITESFLSQKHDSVTSEKDSKNESILLLSHAFDKRKYKLEEYLVLKLAAICPEYDVNFPYLNNLFSGSELVCRNCTDSNFLSTIDTEDIHFHPNFEEGFNKQYDYTNVKIIGLEDGVKLVSINDYLFSAKAGNAEEAFRYEYIGQKNISKDSTNLLRGEYGPYLGIVGYENVGHLIDIKIPGYKISNLPEYFSIRYNDLTPYYTISDRFEFKTIDLEWGSSFEIQKELEEEKEELTVKEKYYMLEDPIYRGDCYICQFTHRINRNFQDPSSPSNDEIVDEYCWRNNYKVEDGVVKIEDFDKINLGDVNAVLLGMYITLPIRSSINLNIRSLDSSYPDEKALFGHYRGFYPYNPMSNRGAYKIPESLCYNKGFEKSVSEKFYIGVPDVPWIKNEFSNRIAYSNVLIKDAFQNGWRTFMGTHYQDYSKEYGSITKLVEWNGKLVVVCEHGVLLIAVNERAIAALGQQGLAYITNVKVLPDNPDVISDKIGSLWRESIIKTSHYIYGVDTVARKIWRTNGQTMEYISDNRIQEFLNNNITLTERELTPIIGVRNVKTHYNAFKDDVMFTFYDNLYGFSERVWNLCFNEALQKWITFYSWVPSYSENIYNSYFSFDRNTSKWIAKLGTSKEGNSFSDGIVLSNNVISEFEKSEKDYHYVGTLSLVNRSLPTGTNLKNIITYTLERDNYLNYQYFTVDKRNIVEKSKYLLEEPKVPEQLEDESDELFKNRYNKYLENYKNWEEGNTYALYINPDITYKKLCSELYIKTITGKDKIYPNDSNYRLNLKIYKDERGRRKNLPYTDENGNIHEAIYPDRIVRLLNIKASIKTGYKLEDGSFELAEAYEGSNNTRYVDAGYYKSVVAVIPEYNMQFLSTDFWRHGLAGIIDIADKILPTYWYGKQHPFEFEFIVTDNPDTQKLFDNLKIISNKAEPESFHYEIIGECYDFAKDKKNMYIRLEATKELYQYNGIDLEYNPDYKDLEDKPRYINDSEITTAYYDLYDKSTIFPQWYYRLDTINEIEDSYHLLEENSKHFDLLAGAEIVRYENLDEYRIWNHAKATNMRGNGRIRGNMMYEDDIWKVLINPINIILKNETPSDWLNKFGKGEKSLVPAELNNFHVLDNLITDNDEERIRLKELKLPENWERNIVKWGYYEQRNKEIKLKDKFLKVRIRYSGEDLAIISTIKTIYRISNL